MYNIFFGDSITAGETLNLAEQNFTEYLGGRVDNFAISGTTMGEYSIYPVDGNSLLSLIAKYENEIAEANNIYLEYGCNDVSAIMCGFADETKVLISFVKAIDWIRQLNPRCEIYFLSLSNNTDIITMFAKGQCNYLTNDYFKDYDFRIPYVVWADKYNALIKGISNRVKVIPMFTEIEWENDISSDGMHPNVSGHRKIAETVL